MNKYINNIAKTIAIPALLLGALSCTDPDDLVTANATEGGLLKTNTSALNYVVGNPGPYKVEFVVPRTQEGGVSVTSIDLYKRFETSPIRIVEEDGEEVEVKENFVSNEILAKTITTSGDQVQTVSDSFMYTDLIAGLEIERLDGSVGPLPELDGELLIGDKWVFRVVANLSDGRKIVQSYEISAGVSTRYAGKYKAVAAEYYRLGVLTYSTADWPAETVIESVDATTYRVVEYLGAAAFTGNEYFFQIIDGVITYPDEKPNGDPQVGNDQPFIDCASNAADMAEVHCDNSNFVTNNDETGKDRLTMSYGYITPGSGPRVFYQVLEKIVE